MRKVGNLKDLVCAQNVKQNGSFKQKNNFEDDLTFMMYT